MQQTYAQLLFGMGYDDMPWLTGMDENVMTPFYAAKVPSVFFKSFDELLAVHGGYDNHSTEKVKI